MGGNAFIIDSLIKYENQSNQMVSFLFFKLVFMHTLYSFLFLLFIFIIISFLYIWIVAPMLWPCDLHEMIWVCYIVKP